MSMDAELALQQAIQSRLMADGPLAALLDGRIYDDVPAQAPFPYLASGEARSRDWSSGDSIGTDVTLTLIVYSRAHGRREAKEIAGAVKAALHEADLALTDHTLVSLRFRDGHIARQRDGITWRQELRFRALVEKT
ncbi:DUF3168 domain-containing protein [Parvibaculum sp. MBR-TMA-1.3b-4.2]|jgi:hypothetical protein